MKNYLKRFDKIFILFGCFMVSMASSDARAKEVREKKSFALRGPASVKENLPPNTAEILKMKDNSVFQEKDIPSSKNFVIEKNERSIPRMGTLSNQFRYSDINFKFQK